MDNKPQITEISIAKDEVSRNIDNNLQITEVSITKDEVSRNMDIKPQITEVSIAKDEVPIVETKPESAEDPKVEPVADDVESILDKTGRRRQFWKTVQDNKLKITERYNAKDKTQKSIEPPSAEDPENVPSKNARLEKLQKGLKKAIKDSDVRGTIEKIMESEGTQNAADALTKLLLSTRSEKEKNNIAQMLATIEKNEKTWSAVLPESVAKPVSKTLHAVSSSVTRSI